MRLLIDTHALLWFCEGNSILSQNARAAMEDDTNERFVSHASAWEVAIKVSIGKLKLQTDFWAFVGSDRHPLRGAAGGFP